MAVTMSPLVLRRASTAFSRVQLPWAMTRSMSLEANSESSPEAEAAAGASSPTRAGASSSPRAEAPAPPRPAEAAAWAKAEDPWSTLGSPKMTKISPEGDLKTSGSETEKMV